MPQQHQFTADDYTVGIICALHQELFAVRCLIDSIHPCPPISSRDTNSYVLGTMAGHRVVATCLPAGEYGTNAAASVASQLVISFPAIKFSLLVGIAGGVPGREDIRLGDVVVSLPTGTRPGVIQYDLGEATPGDNFVEIGSLQRPSRILLGAINDLRSDPHLGINPLQPYLDVIAKLRHSYTFPGRQQDILFPADYVHLDGTTCDHHLDSQVRRQTRVSDHPYIYYGLIASGNKVIRDAVLRDRVAQRLNILCFEMEAAGIPISLPGLVIRGICDYSDSHKTKVWQEYAAATAAAYAKLLLRYVRYNKTHELQQTVVDNHITTPQQVHQTPGNGVLGNDDCIVPNAHSIDIPAQPAQPLFPRMAENILFKAHSYAERSRLWNSLPSDAVPLMASLKQWAECRGPNVLVLEPRGWSANIRAETFAFEVIRFLQSRGQPVLWALWPEYDEPLTSEDIVDSLVDQALQSHINPEVPGDFIRNPDFLVKILDQLDAVFLVLQVKDSALAARLVQALQVALQQPRTILKVLLVSYWPDLSGMALKLLAARIQPLNPLPPRRKDNGPMSRWWSNIHPCLEPRPNYC